MISKLMTCSANIAQILPTLLLMYSPKTRKFLQRPMSPLRKCKRFVLILSSWLVGFKERTLFFIRKISLNDQEHSNKSRQTFQHISSSVGALEAEEVGVEHLLRDVMDSTISPLSTQINQKLLSLRSLTSRLKDMSLYLGKVSDGTLPPNHKLINQIQDIFNLLPNINTEGASPPYPQKWLGLLLSLRTTLC